MKEVVTTLPSLPMPGLRTIDLTGSKLNVVQANVLRGSDYDAWVKLAFNSMRCGGQMGKTRIEMATISTLQAASRSPIYLFKLDSNRCLSIIRRLLRHSFGDSYC